MWSQENSVKSSHCSCVQDKEIPALEQEIFVLGTYFAASKGEENACRTVVVNTKKECNAIEEKLKKNSEDEERKKELSQKLHEQEAKQSYFENKLQHLESRCRLIFLDLAGLSFKRQQALNHVKYH